MKHRDRRFGPIAVSLVRSISPTLCTWLPQKSLHLEYQLTSRKIRANTEACYTYGILQDHLKHTEGVHKHEKIATINRYPVISFLERSFSRHDFKPWRRLLFTPVSYGRLSLLVVSAPLVMVESGKRRLYKNSLIGRISSSRPLLVAAMGPG